MLMPNAQNRAICFQPPMLWRCAQVDQSGVNHLWIKMERVRDSYCTGALPLRHIPRLPSLTSQSRHLSSLADRPFPRIPPPIPSTRVLVPMCRSSRYEGPRAPPTSAGGQVAGLVGRRGCLLRVISRAAGCGALCGVRSASLRGSVAVSRDWRVSAGRGAAGRDVVVSTRH